MKIRIMGEASLVQHVSVDLDTAAQQLHVLITTRERWAPHQLSGGWGLFGRECPEGAAPPAHRLIAVGEVGAEEGKPGAEVVLLPDTKEEQELLYGCAYELFEKDQIRFLIVPIRKPIRAVIRPLAHWPT